MEVGKVAADDHLLLNKQLLTFWAFSLINYLSLNSKYDDMYVFYIPVFKNHFVTKISLTHLKIISKNEDSPDI